MGTNSGMPHVHVHKASHQVMLPISVLLGTTVGLAVIVILITASFIGVIVYVVKIRKTTTAATKQKVI